MAKVNGNIFIDRMSGMIGDQMIIRRVRGGRTIIGVKPTITGERTFSEAQLAQQQAFREATAYARAKKKEPIYVDLASGSARTAYNVAVADWFNEPEILEVDLGRWNGASGEVIRMRVQDDVKVEQVSVQISNGTGAPLEEGQASDSGALWWEYTTSGDYTGNLTVTISARDLPGHITQASEQKTISGQ